jgi:hypothetical protein
VLRIAAPHAQVKLDGRVIATDVQLVREPLDRDGVYDLEVDAPGWQLFRARVEVSGGAEVLVPIEPAPLPARPAAVRSVPAPRPERRPAKRGGDVAAGKDDSLIDPFEHKPKSGDAPR